MRALVTGGGGFIGSHLVRALIPQARSVRVLDNFSTGYRGNLADVAEDIDIVEGDLRSYERVHTAVRGIDVVFHQAALPAVPRSVQDPLTTNAVNIEGTLNVLLASRDEDVRRVIFASSSSIYGNAPELPRVETARPAPLSPYAVAKLAAEFYCASFTHVYGLETVSLRYFNVFGPRQDPRSQYAAVVPFFMRLASEGRVLPITGDGSESRDFTFVDDVVRANILAADAPGAGGRVFNAGAGRQVTVDELIACIGEVLGREVRAENVAPRPGDVLHSWADITAAREVLGYEPHTDLLTGLKRFAEWSGFTSP